MDVGVRELKQQLSKYVERAAAGETITVTDRGVPKAVLGPVPGAVQLAEGIAQGWIQPAKGRRLGKARPAKSRRRIADVLDEDRGE